MLVGNKSILKFTKNCLKFTIFFYKKKCCYKRNKNFKERRQKLYIKSKLPHWRLQKHYNIFFHNL